MKIPRKKSLLLIAIMAIILFIDSVVPSSKQKEPEMTATVNFRIEDVRRVTLNGRSVKLFKFYTRQGNAFVFDGQFAAPARTATKNLHLFAH